MNLRERLEIRALGHRRYGAGAAEMYQLLTLADHHGEEAVLDWLRAGIPTMRLDVPALDYLLGSGITVERYQWIANG